MFRSILVLALLLSLTSVVMAGDGTVFTVTGDEVQIRSGPGTRHPVLGKLSREGWVVVVGAEGRWKKVRIPGGFVCFVHESLVKQSEDGPAEVTADRVLLRATANKEHGPLDTRLARGDELTVLGTEGEWVKVISPERVTAWIFEDLMKELGPAEEYRAALARAAAKRRILLLGDRPERQEKIRTARNRAARQKAVVEIGKEVLAGKGDTSEQERRLKRLALESDDDLTRGYANALLSLVSLRRDAEKLKESLAEAEKRRAEDTEKVRVLLAAAEKRYEAARKRAEALKASREKRYRAVGTIEKREEGYVLVEKNRVIFYLDAKRFRLADYVGKRVGVNGRVMVTDESKGRTHLLVEKMEILPGKPSGRSDR